MASLRITGTGIETGSQEIINDTVVAADRHFDSDRAGMNLEQWIDRVYGIKIRYHATKDQMPSDLAYSAACKAIDAAGIKKEQIDFILVNTVFGDFSQPTTATALQSKLGLDQKLFALEINMPCAGPVYSLFLADCLLKSTNMKTGLLVGVDKISPFVDQHDFRVSALFSDAAGACIVTKSETGGLLDYTLGSSGESGVDPSSFGLVIPGGKANQPHIDAHNQTDLFLHMNGGKVKQFILDSFSEVYYKLVPESSYIDHIIPHQASLSVLKEAFEICGIPWSKAIMTLGECGNTSSASVYFGLHKFIESNRGENSKILIYAMGGGLNWGGLIYENS